MSVKMVPKIVVIIQARLGSRRLPGKVLLPLGGKPVIAHVVERARLIPKVSCVVVATSSSKTDDKLADYCETMGVPLFRGDESDVLDRYYKAARHYGAEAVMRITGDCPLVDPVESGRVVDFFLSGSYDYASNTVTPTLPDGLDTEIFSAQALFRAWESAKTRAEREHVTLHFYTHPEMYAVGSLTCSEDLSQYRFTLDEPVDYDFLQEIFSHLERRVQFGYLQEILQILEEYPGLLTINGKVARNEGLMVSLEKEKEG